MVKPDNSTPHLSAAYDSKVRSTIPYYDCLHAETINFVKATSPSPGLWLDTGCGTGTLALKAAEAFPDTRFVLSDPSAQMLSEARKKLAHLGGRVDFPKPMPTQQLTEEVVGRPDVATAIQSHHYMKKEGREEAVRRCHALLKPGGIFITFENIRPVTRDGLALGLKYWGGFQISEGRGADEVKAHMARLDREYFPITVEEHLALLRGAGFRVVEMLWFSYMQAGFYCIK